MAEAVREGEPPIDDTSKIVSLLEQQVKMAQERDEREKGGEVFGALFGAGDKVTSFSLSQFLPRDFLRDRGFAFTEEEKERGADYRKPREFGEGIQGYERWLRAVFGGLWDYGLILDEGVRTFLKGEVVREKNLVPEEKQRILSLANGLFFIHNYNLAWLGSNGEMPAFAASPQEGGVVSRDERDRLSFTHLKEQCLLFPGMARALSLVDSWAAKQIYNPPADEKAREIYHRTLETPEVYCQTDLSANDLGLEGARPWEINYQKELALAWFRIAGFLDTRNYQEKHRRYTDLMPTKEADLKTEAGRKKYEEATEFRRWGRRYDSPYTFLLDPLGLFADVQKNYQDIIDNIRVGIRESQSEHNVLNLGWRPAAWLLLEKFAGKSLKPSDLPGPGPGATLTTIAGNKTLADLSEGEWEGVIDPLVGVDLQKVNIKNGVKAGRALEALAKSFSLEPKEFVGLFAAVTSYLRSDNKEKDGIFTKSSVLPILVRAINEIIESMETQGVKLPLTDYDMKLIAWQIEFLVRPAVVFSSDKQKQWFIKAGRELGAASVLGR